MIYIKFGGLLLEWIGASILGFQIKSWWGFLGVIFLTAGQLIYLTIHI